MTMASARRSAVAPAPVPSPTARRGGEEAEQSHTKKLTPHWGRGAGGCPGPPQQPQVCPFAPRLQCHPHSLTRVPSFIGPEVLHLFIHPQCHQPIPILTPTSLPPQPTQVTGLTQK